MTDPLRDGKPDRAPADGEQVNELTEQPDYRTGYQMPDPKDDHQRHYTTTPPEDRVGSADHGVYQPVEAQDPKEITGQFDHLATRDPVAMEHAPQRAEFAGAQTVEGLGINTDTPMDLVAPMAVGMAVTSSMATAEETEVELRDPNRNYVPPGKEVVPHVPEEPGDLLPGTPPEIKAEVAGTEDNDDRL
ncbi:hypothetical protein E5F05_17975 [Deinococcus metallilatus]|uniref:Uncharacterized protein n=1 Tax=Deinococcus metallilatus TaxID=1211322 RepID=A0AAJ5F063_9DEIO|nr:hypothetical protein [Deinococcus metallilatus]MBB5297242.1 hypothetical protein [Deinococcus metallilatus]QBY09660.1 hypothetical protein E5F05_17975 [Deinococcus metallilatus]RXJ09032.1 hypothetical protein ERJ73_16815 [Deinococcus metallilatus]TLK21287.1 hypothetical protein FCS05_19105 [Deinococcus metallilatus]GMA17185.1 hypothetical protein GCM10025871_35160 [Deinococcus metallilatus]